MSLNMHYQFIDISQIPQNIVWTAIGLAIPYIWKKFKQWDFTMSMHKIWRKFQWSKIGLHAISLLVCFYVGKFWEFFGLKIVSDQVTKVMIINLKCGFYIFKKLEPEVADAILVKVKEWLTKEGLI